MSILPPGFANATNALYAGTKCGNYTQTTQFVTDSTVPTVVGFTTPATWSDTSSFTSDAGLIWGCQTAGVYNLRFNQTLDVTATLPVADTSIVVIPNSTLFLDISGTLVAPQDGVTLLHPNTDTQSSISYSSVIIETVLMGSFTTSPGFLTSLAVPGGTWTLSLFANTSNTDENNTAYISVYTVDADGSSNPVLILDGAAGTPFIVNGTDIFNYISTFTVPTFTVANLSKRIQFRLYGIFGTSIVTNIMAFYFRNATLSSVETTISQDVVPPIIDTVNVSITVDSVTSEFNQVFTSSIPITTVFGYTTTYSTAVNAIANIDAGDQVTCTIASVQGNVTATSGETTLPAPANTLQWNLIAQGSYGNNNIVLAEPMTVENFGIQDRP